MNCLANLLLKYCLSVFATSCRSDEFWSACRSLIIRRWLCLLLVEKVFSLRSYYSLTADVTVMELDLGPLVLSSDLVRSAVFGSSSFVRCLTKANGEPVRNCGDDFASVLPCVLRGNSLDDGEWWILSDPALSCEESNTSWMSPVSGGSLSLAPRWGVEWRGIFSFFDERSTSNFCPETINPYYLRCTISSPSNLLVRSILTYGTAIGFVERAAVTVLCSPIVSSLWDEGMILATEVAFSKKKVNRIWWKRGLYQHAWCVACIVNSTRHDRGEH